MSEITIAFLFKHFKFSPSKATVLKFAETRSKNKRRSGDGAHEDRDSNSTSLLIHGRKKDFGRKYSLGTVTRATIRARTNKFSLIHVSLKDGITLAITEVGYFAL